MHQEETYQISMLPEECISNKAEHHLLLNYSEILSKFGIVFRRVEKYLEVGEIDWIQGWILDISVISLQVSSLLECILPLLIRENTPFRLVRNLEIARMTLGGGLGYADLGKIISLYPRDDTQALYLAQQLIALTSSFKGPEIPTNRQLAGVIYTRYGACKPIIQINDRNTEEKYIYGPKGILVKEPLSIPFHLPEGITWPFGAIASSQLPKKESVLQDRYKPMAILKVDAKGSVRKGLWLEKIYKIRWCIIKEGRKCMTSDESGRDIHDRLEWQFDLQKDLKDHIPIPKVYDFFKENGNSYLVMELIKGVPLDSLVVNILRGKPWPAQSLDIRLQLLNYVAQILNIIETMHQKGYIHRDIAPYNFLVSRQQQLWMIDLELTYSERLHRPSPPFRLGTPGFMSPEQEAVLIPTKEQDIYALGAMLILILTGLFPGGFSTDCEQILKNQLNFLIGDDALVIVLTRCLSMDPNFRPTLRALKISIEEFRTRQISSPFDLGKSISNLIVNKESLKKAITCSINGLSTPIALNSNHLWFSRKEEDEDFTYYQSKSVSVYKGFYQGLSGVLYTLAKAHRSGFSISSCIKGYETSLAYIQQKPKTELSSSPGGLYIGTAGMALALIEGIESGLINKESAIEEEIKLYLQNEHTDGYGIAKGIAGKGLVLLRSIKVSNDPTLLTLLQNIVDQLLALQQKDGSWVVENSFTKQRTKEAGFANGASGITCFLLEYLKTNNDKNIEKAAVKSLRWVIRQSHETKGQLIWQITDKKGEENAGMDNGLVGILLCLVKAYEVFQDSYYRQLVEKTASLTSENYVKRDLTLSTGLTGIGELCLEAAKIFASEKWQTHANWISNFLSNYFIKQKDGSYYWLTEEIPFPTASLMLGNCGVLHFLLRCYTPKHLSHPLLIV